MFFSCCTRFFSNTAGTDTGTVDARWNAGLRVAGMAVFVMSIFCVQIVNRRLLVPR